MLMVCYDIFLHLQSLILILIPIILISILSTSQWFLFVICYSALREAIRIYSPLFLFRVYLSYQNLSFFKKWRGDFSWFFLLRKTDFFERVLFPWLFSEKWEKKIKFNLFYLVSISEMTEFGQINSWWCFFYLLGSEKDDQTILKTRYLKIWVRGVG